MREWRARTVSTTSIGPHARTHIYLRSAQRSCIDSHDCRSLADSRARHACASPPPMRWSGHAMQQSHVRPLHRSDGDTPVRDGVTGGTLTLTQNAAHGSASICSHHRDGHSSAAEGESDSSLAGNSARKWLPPSPCRFTSVGLQFGKRSSAARMHTGVPERSKRGEPKAPHSCS